MSSQANLFDALVTTVTLGVHTETQSSGAEEDQGRHAEPQTMSLKRAKKLGVKRPLCKTMRRASQRRSEDKSCAVLLRPDIR